MLSLNRADHLALSKYAISSQSRVPKYQSQENGWKPLFLQLPAKRTFQGSILGLNGPTFRAQNLDKNKNIY